MSHQPLPICCCYSQTAEVTCKVRKILFAKYGAATRTAGIKKKKKNMQQIYSFILAHIISIDLKGLRLPETSSVFPCYIHTGKIYMKFTLIYPNPLMSDKHYYRRSYYTWKLLEFYSCECRKQFG